MDDDDVVIDFSPREQNLLADIMGMNEETKFNFHSLIAESLNYIKVCEEEEEEVEMGDSFLNFLVWISSEVAKNNNFWKLHKKQIEIFEDILNSNLSHEDIRGFNGIPGFYLEIMGKKHLNDMNTPLSGCELEFEKRLTKLYNTNSNFEQLFLDMNKYDGMSWEEFEKIL
jgi:hypothetical protein